MKTNQKTEEMNEWIAEICPQAINKMRDLLNDPTAPVPSKVQLIGMILDRTLGKTETPLKVTNVNETMEEAEEQLEALVQELQNNKEDCDRGLSGRPLIPSDT